MKRDKTHCCVPQCHSSGTKNPTLHFHKFPNVKLAGAVGIKNVNRKKEWIRVLKIGKEVSGRMSVCSKHFKEDDYIRGKAIRKRLKIYAVPSLHLPVLPSDNIQRITEKKKNAEKRAERYVAREKNTEASDNNIDADNLDTPCVHDVDDLDDEVVTAAEAILQLSTAMKEASEIENAINPETCNKQTQVTSGDFLLGTFIKVSVLKRSELNCLTGLPNKETLSALVDCIEKEVADKPKRNMIVEDRIVMTMMVIKLNLSFVVLAVFFRCTSTTCRTIFLETLHALAAVLNSVIVWPTKEQVMANMPVCFKKFSSVRAVLDCTEIEIEKSKCLRCQIQTYSQYYGCQTAKYLICITPGGIISYVSMGYGGRASDKKIFEDSRIIECFEPHIDSVMVDKGFLIEDICENFYIKLIRPPFLENKKQFSVAEAAATKNIATARVHVERAIQRLKVFKLINGGKTPWRLINVLDEVLIVVAGLTNISNSIFGDDKYLL